MPRKGNASRRPSLPLQQSSQQVMQAVHPNWQGRPTVTSTHGDVTAPTPARPLLRSYDDVQGFFKQMVLASGLHQERNYLQEKYILLHSGGVHNDVLEEAYKQKMTELRSCGRNPVGLQEQIFFAAFDDENAAFEVLRNGLHCRNDLHNQKAWIEDIGNLSAGVYLCRHADLLAMRRIGQTKFFFVIFKVFLGRQAVVKPCTVQWPTPFYDSHVSCGRSVLSPFLEEQLSDSQVYLFDWDIRNPGGFASRPRQCLPVGYVEVHRQQSLAHHHPQTHSVAVFPNEHLSPTGFAFLPPAQTVPNGAATLPNLPIDAIIHNRHLPQQQQPRMTFETQPPAPAYSSIGPRVPFTRQFPAQLVVDVTSQQMRQTPAVPAASAAFTGPHQVQLSPQTGQLASPVSQPRDAWRVPPCLKGPFTAPGMMTSSGSYGETNARPTASIPDMPSPGVYNGDQCQQLNQRRNRQQDLELQQQQLLLQQQQRQQRQEQPSSRPYPVLSSLITAPESVVSLQPSANQQPRPRPRPPPCVVPTIQSNVHSLYRHRPQLLPQSQHPLPTERSSELQMQNSCNQSNVPLHQNIMAQPSQTCSMTSANDSFTHVFNTPTMMSGYQSTEYRQSSQPTYANANQVCTTPAARPPVDDANGTSQFPQCTSNVGHGPSSARPKPRSRNHSQSSVGASHHQLTTVSVPDVDRSRNPPCEPDAAVTPRTVTDAPVPGADNISQPVNSVVSGVEHADDSVRRHKTESSGNDHVPVAGTNPELSIAPRVLPSFDDVRILFERHRVLSTASLNNISIALNVCINSVDNARQGKFQDHPCLQDLPNLHQLHIDLTIKWPKTVAFLKYFGLNRSILQASQFEIDSADLSFLRLHLQFLSWLRSQTEKLVYEKLWNCLMAKSVQLDLRLVAIVACSNKVLTYAKLLVHGLAAFVHKLYKYVAVAETSNNQQPQSSGASSSPAVAAVDVTAVPVASSDQETVQTERNDDSGDRSNAHLEGEVSDVSGEGEVLPDVERQCQEAADNNSVTVDSTQPLASEPTAVEGFDQQQLSRDSPAVDTSSAGLLTVKTEVREDDVDVKPKISRNEDLFVDLTFVDDEDDDDVMVIFYRGCLGYNQAVKKEKDAASGPSSPNSAVTELSEVPPASSLLAIDSSQEENAAVIDHNCVSVDDLIREVIARDDVNVPARTTDTCDGVLNESSSSSSSLLLKSTSMFSASCAKVKIEKDVVLSTVPDEMSAAADEQVSSPPSVDESSAIRFDVPCSQSNVEQTTVVKPLSEKDQFSSSADGKLAGAQFRLSKKWAYVPRAADELTVKIEGDDGTRSTSDSPAIRNRRRSAGDDKFMSSVSDASVADQKVGFPKTEPDDDVAVTVESHAVVHLKIEPTTTTNFDQTAEEPTPPSGVDQTENLPERQMPPVITDSVNDQVSSESSDVIGEEADVCATTQANLGSPVPVSATTACDKVDSPAAAAAGAESDCDADYDEDDDVELFYNPKMYQGVMRSPAVQCGLPMNNVAETSHVTSSPMASPAEKYQPEVMDRMDSPDVLECPSSPEVEAVDAPQMMERVGSPDVMELEDRSPLSDRCYRIQSSSPWYSDCVPADDELPDVNGCDDVEGQTTEDENLEGEMTAAVSIAAAGALCCRYETISPATVETATPSSLLHSENASNVNGCVMGSLRATDLRDVEPEEAAVAAEYTVRDDDGCRYEAISPTAVAADSISGIDSESAGYFSSSDSGRQSPRVNEDPEERLPTTAKNSIFSELNASIRVAKEQIVKKLLQSDKTLRMSDGELNEYADDSQPKDLAIRHHLEKHRKVRDRKLTWKVDERDSRMQSTYNDLAAKNMPITWQCRHRPEMVIVLPKELRLKSEENVDVGKEVSMVLAPSRGISVNKYVRLYALTEVIDKTGRDDVNYETKQKFLHDKRKALLRTICCSTERERVEMIKTLKERLDIYCSVEQRSAELRDEVGQIKRRVRRYVTMLEMFTVDDCGNWTQKTGSSDHGDQNASTKDNTSRSNSGKGNTIESHCAVQLSGSRTSPTDSCSETTSNRPRIVLSIAEVKQTPLAEPSAAASFAVKSDNEKKKRARKEKNIVNQPAGVLAKVKAATSSKRSLNSPGKKHVKTKHVDRGGNTNALRDATIRHGDNNCHKKQKSNTTETGNRKTIVDREKSTSSVKTIVQPTVTSVRVKHPSGGMGHNSCVSSSHKRKLPLDIAATVALKKVRKDEAAKSSVTSPTGQKIRPLPLNMKKIPKLTVPGAQSQYERTSLENSLYHRSQRTPQRLGT